VGGLDAGLKLEQFAEKMRRRAEAARRERVLAGVFLQIRDQFRHRVDRNGRIDDQNVVAGADSNERREIDVVFERRIGKERRRGRDRGGDGQDRMTIGRLLEHLHRADRGQGAGLVFDHHLPALAVRQRVRDHACQDVGRRRSGVRHDDPNDIRWKRFRKCGLEGGGAETIAAAPVKNARLSMVFPLGLLLVGLQSPGWFQSPT
jgi:hypothetical protein